MKENREVLRKYLGQEIKLIATYEKERKDGRIIRKLFVDAYVEETNEYIGHIHINKNEFTKKPCFKHDKKYRLNGYVVAYKRGNGSDGLGLDKVTVEKL